jgi:hypothetical protein
MSRGKGKGAPPPAALPVPRVRLVRDESGEPGLLADTPAGRSLSSAPARRTRKRRSRFVF